MITIHLSVHTSNFRAQDFVTII